MDFTPDYSMNFGTMARLTKIREKVVFSFTLKWFHVIIILLKIIRRPIHSITNNIDFIVLLRFYKIKKSNVYINKGLCKKYIYDFYKF